MRIKVQYQDETFGEIEAYLLDDLIRKKQIKKLRRSGKWVIIGSTPIITHLPERRNYWS